MSIDKKTKLAVWERQNGKSVVSGKPITWSDCCCHFISRAKGGLGIEENIVGMTWEEHMIFDLNMPGDHLQQSKEFRAMAKKHLMDSYPGWDESKLVYKKY